MVLEIILGIGISLISIIFIAIYIGLKRDFSIKISHLEKEFQLKHEVNKIEIATLKGKNEVLQAHMTKCENKMIKEVNDGV